MKLKIFQKLKLINLIFMKSKYSINRVIRVINYSSYFLPEENSLFTNINSNNLMSYKKI